MDELSIDTPEQIELSYDLAGIGSRFCAAFIDLILIGAMLAVGWFVIGDLIISGAFDETLSNWVIAIVSIIVFAINWGYHILFDLIRNGQSPGKGLLRLRVIKDSGYPINFADSAIRNLVRFVDFLPMFYGIGGMSMILDKKWRRLGDFAAGTLVIKERRGLTPNQLVAHIAQKSTFTYRNWIRLDQVTDVELSTIREYLSRRHTLSTQRRRQLARTIGMPIAQRMGIVEPIDYNILLDEIFALATSQQHTP